MTDVSIVGLNLLQSSRGTIGHDQYANWGALLINVTIIGRHRTLSVLQVNKNPHPFVPMTYHVPHISWKPSGCLKRSNPENTSALNLSSTSGGMRSREKRGPCVYLAAHHSSSLA